MELMEQTVANVYKRIEYLNTLKPNSSISIKAVKENDEETALEYLANKNINALYEDNEKWSPLMWA